MFYDLLWDELLERKRILEGQHRDERLMMLSMISRLLAPTCQTRVAGLTRALVENYKWRAFTW